MLAQRGAWEGGRELSSQGREGNVRQKEAGGPFSDGENAGPSHVAGQQ